MLLGGWSEEYIGTKHFAYTYRVAQKVSHYQLKKIVLKIANEIRFIRKVKV